MLEPATLLFLDIIVFVTCSILLFRFGRIRASHPASVYLFFHFYVFTARLLSYATGVEGLFSTWDLRFEAVTLTELTRAAIIADVTLVVMTIAMIRASVVDVRRHGPMPQLGEEKAPNLYFQHIWYVIMFVLPIGIIGFLSYSYVPFLNDSRTRAGSSWLGITQTWPGIVLVMLIYYFGFKTRFMIPMGAYLVIMGLQGHHRFRIVIVAIILALIYIDRQGRKWPSVRVTAFLLVLALLFFPLKTIGRMVQRGESFSSVGSYSAEVVSNALSGEAGDQQFMDQFAAALTLTDNYGSFYYGRTYLNLIILPIPRVLWPDKPGLADFLYDISTPSRPLARLGMITTFLGESYVNFGYLGVLFIPYLLAYWLTRLHFTAYRNNYYSVARLAYLVVACGLIQVFRDGLTSLVLFTVVNMMPIFMVIFLYYVLPIRRDIHRRVSGIRPVNQAA